MEWKDVVGYEGIYEVSDTGKVRTKEGKATYSTRWKTERVWQQRTLRQKVSKDNSSRVSLWKDRKEKTWLVHRLVAKAFIPRVEGKNYINHIDGSRLNNHVSNLEWCDHKENNNHAFDNDLMTCNNKIVLVHDATKEAHYFRSLSKASEFLGFNSGYLSGAMRKEGFELDEYTIFVEAEKSERVGVY